MTSYVPRIAVTGANGYVGSIIARALEPISEVIRLVRKPSERSDVEWSLDARYDRMALELVRRDVTHLVHAAWDMTANTKHGMQRTCVEGSARLFDAAKDAGVQRVIFISAIDAFVGARSAYGQAKLAVERMALNTGGLVLRLGLVYGKNEGRAFGSLAKAVHRTRFVPMLGDGCAPQYVLHEDTLIDVVRRASRGDFDGENEPLTIAQPDGIAFRSLLKHIANGQGRRLILVPVPWRVLYLALKMRETVGLKLNIFGDSVMRSSFQNPTPDFNALDRFGIYPRCLNVGQ